MVRLLHRWQERRFGPKQSFNPTMVRLLHLIGGLAIPALYPFQSHNGSIATRIGGRNAATKPKNFQSHNGSIATEATLRGLYEKLTFQSHNGSIAAEQPTEQPPEQPAFNPTMVRLLRGWQRKC